MHDLDKPYTDSIQQWDIACDCFKAEFKFDPNEIVTIDTIREMFAELVDDHELSQNASISLMFALYFLGYVTLLEIMKALGRGVPVMILDEPTAGVDVELRRTLWRFMRDLHSKGTTVVLTTHYLEEAQEMCDRIAIVDKGSLRIVETTEGLLNRHPFRFLTLKLADGAAMPAHLAELVTSVKGGAVELKLDRERHPIASVFAGLKAAGIEIADVSTREPDLEDIFVELNRVGFDGAVSIEWEDNDADQLAGAKAALANCRKADLPPVTDAWPDAPVTLVTDDLDGPAARQGGLRDWRVLTHAQYEVQQADG